MSSIVFAFDIEVTSRVRSAGGFHDEHKVTTIAALGDPDIYTVGDEPREPIPNGIAGWIAHHIHRPWNWADEDDERQDPDEQAENEQFTAGQARQLVQFFGRPTVMFEGAENKVIIDVPLCAMLPTIPADTINFLYDVRKSFPWEQLSFDHFPDGKVGVKASYDIVKFRQVYA